VGQAAAVAYHRAVVLVILIVSVVIVATLTAVLGRWMQRKGREMERGRDEDVPPPR
jgi:putative effector of murein hydrolase LrgA (UPF0299 family)